MPEVQITAAQVVDGDGPALATIERVRIGGGIRVIEGEEHQHPTLHLFHVRLLSPDRMIPDELREAETYEEAVELALRYGALRVEHASRVAELAEDLKLA